MKLSPATATAYFKVTVVVMLISTGVISFGSPPEWSELRVYMTVLIVWLVGAAPFMFFLKRSNI